VVKVKYVVLENGSWQAIEISTLVAGKLPPTPAVTSTTPPSPTETLFPAEFEFSAPSEAVDCVSVETQPEAATLADAYDVPIAEIMGWFCKGFGFGEIEQVYSLRSTTDMSVEEIFAARSSGQGMGEIKQTTEPQPAGKSQSAKPDKPTNDNKPADVGSSANESRPIKTPKP
jgi:hypothetical protein